MSRAMNRRSFLGVGAMGMLAGCASVGRPGRNAGRIATFNADVTPPLGTPVYSSFEPLSVIEHPLQAKGVIIDDGIAPYVLCAVDYCELCNSTHTRFREALAEAAGTEAGRVVVQTVHQHTAPMADADAIRILSAAPNPPPYPAIESIEIPLGRLVAAVREARSHFQPYDYIGTGQAKAERVASNRRVPLGDGKVGFRASSCRDPKLIEAPEGLIDPFVKTVTFAQGDKPLARLHYYATHPQSFYGDPRASIDFPGMAREWLEAREGVFQVYFNGCGGNIAAGKYNDGTPEARRGLYERLRAAMLASAESTRYAPASTIAWRTTPLALTPRADEPHTEGPLAARMAKVDAAHSVRFDAALFLAWKNRAQTPIEISSMRMGDLILLHLAGEMAIEYQLFAQGLRPDLFVAVAAYGDCGPAYINLERFTAEGGYEPSAAHAVPESEKPMRDAIRTLLSV